MSARRIRQAVQARLGRAASASMGDLRKPCGWLAALWQGLEHRHCAQWHAYFACGGLGGGRGRSAELARSSGLPSLQSSRRLGRRGHAARETMTLPVASGADGQQIPMYDAHVGSHSNSSSTSRSAAPSRGLLRVGCGGRRDLMDCGSTVRLPISTGSGNLPKEKQAPMRAVVVGGEPLAFCRDHARSAGASGLP